MVVPQVVSQLALPGDGLALNVGRVQRQLLDVRVVLVNWVTHLIYDHLHLLCFVFRREQWLACHYLSE
jgi:hypothetical protein